MIPFSFSVFLVLAIGSTFASDYEEGIPFEYGGEYAPAYDNYKPRDYHFDYAVSDPHTGDHKSQWEVKENGVVRGAYSLLEPDGTTRVVEYIADDHGFRAVVKKIGTPYHEHEHALPAPQPVVHLPEIVTQAPLPRIVIPEEQHLKVVVPEEAHIQIPEAEAPVLHEVAQEEPIYQSFNAYDGNADNYARWVLQPQEYSVPVHKQEIQQYPLHVYNQEIPQYALPVYKQETQPVHAYRPVEPHVSVEYHGFTGNSDDDSSYTKYDEDDGKRHYEDIAESRPHALALPINFAYKPIPYQYVVKHASGY